MRKSKLLERNVEPNKLARYINKSMIEWGYSPPGQMLIHIFFWDAWVPVIVTVDYLNNGEKTHVHIEAYAFMETRDVNRRDNKIWFRYDGRIKGFTGKITYRSHEKFVTQKNGINVKQILKGHTRIMDNHDCNIIMELFQKIMVELQIEFEQISMRSVDFCL